MRVVNTKRCRLSGGGVRFVPGANDMDEEAVAIAKLDPVVASWFAMGLLLVEDAPAAVVVDELASEPELGTPDETPAESPAPRRRRRGG